MKSQTKTKYLVTYVYEHAHYKNYYKSDSRIQYINNITRVYILSLLKTMALFDLSII